MLHMVTIESKVWHLRPGYIQGASYKRRFRLPNNASVHVRAQESVYFSNALPINI